MSPDDDDRQLRHEPDEPDWPAILDQACAKGFEGNDPEEALEWLRGRYEDEVYDRHRDAEVERSLK